MTEIQRNVELFSDSQKGNNTGEVQQDLTWTHPEIAEHYYGENCRRASYEEEIELLTEPVSRI